MSCMLFVKQTPHPLTSSGMFSGALIVPYLVGKGKLVFHMTLTVDLTS